MHKIKKYTHVIVGFGLSCCLCPSTQANISGGLSKTASHNKSLQDLVEYGDAFVVQLGGFISGFLIVFGFILFAMSIYKMKDPEKTALGMWGAVLSAAIACSSLVFGLIVWLMRASLS